MNFDDKLRDAFDRAAPPAPSADGVRAQLGPAMGRARRRARVRRGVAISTLSLAVAGGGVAAALQLTAADPAEVDTYTSTLPTPDLTAELPTTTAGRPAADTPTTVDATSAPTSTVPDESESPSSSVTGTSTPPPSQPTAPPTTAPTLLDGPHTTPCGSVTFRFDTVVAVESRTITAGYRFAAQGEGSTEVEAKWFEGPGDECQVAAHLEDGSLEVQFDED